MTAELVVEMPPKLDSEIKARVPAEMRSRLEQLAHQRMLKPSDILREALIQYLLKFPQQQQKKEVA